MFFIIKKEKTKYFKLFTFIAILTIAFVGCDSQKKSVRPGLDVLTTDKIDLVNGKRIGIVTNHTALSANGDHIVDVLTKIPNVNITALYAPEHGIRGDREGGKYIESYIDSLTGITVYSLYGKNRKPTSAMLDSVDVLLFDIQDIGARFYTYISTMGLAMEAAAQKKIPFMVLDRPNPITGIIVEGPVREPEYESFVAQYPIPIRHGLTVGELAKMINGERWLENRIQAELIVIPVDNWKRHQWFDQTSLPWIKTSPNMPNVEAATLYPGICLLEGVNVSEGRGTREPFIKIGAPWIEPEELKQELTGSWMYGIELETIQFTPVSILGAVLHPKFEGELCYGFRLNVHDRNTFRSVSFAIYLISAIQKLYPQHVQFKSGFSRLAGTNKILQKIVNDVPAKNIINDWKEELNKFKIKRKKYLLYN